MTLEELMKHVLLNDDGNQTCKEGDRARWFPCMKCNKTIVAKELFENQNVICPFCKNKFKVRLFKNGRIDVSVR